MSVVFELIDAPYPHLCALYRCSCGAESTRFGDEAAVPPPGWTVDPPADEADEDVRCPRCGVVPAQRPS
jgi:DNA-directed RNA polymerase subunit RPC12/RpoP